MLVKNKVCQWEALPKEEISKAIEARKPWRVPLVRTKWWGEGLWGQYGSKLDELDRRFPTDVIDPQRFLIIDFKNMGLSWEVPDKGAIDAMPVMDDWGKLDEFIAKFPDPKTDKRIDRLMPIASAAHKEGKYLMHTQWSLFYERPWQIRGMQNLLIDYYVNPKNVHALNRALCDLYIEYIRVVAEKLSPDGYWASDDLGHQTQLMMPPEIFREFIKPYYFEIGKTLKENNMHWWLHSCGNNTDILGDLAEVGVDMFHPVQKHAMDATTVAKKYGGQLGFCVGFDVQQILQKASPQQVREEVRFLIDTFDRPEGRMCLAAGNGIVAGTPLENIEAFLDEALNYGRKHRKLYE